MTTLRFDLKAQITRAGLLGSAQRFFAWWRGCLWEMMPPGGRARLTSMFRRWIVRVDGETWKLRSPASDYDDLVLDLAMSDEELRRRIAEVAPASRERRVEVAMPADSGLIRRLRLPVAAGERLRSVVGLQLDRLSPFRAEDVQFDCRVVDGEANGEIVAEVAIVPAQTLKEIEGRLRRLGLSARRFLIADQPFRFAPTQPRQTAYERLNRVLGVAAISTCVLAIVLAPVLRALERDGLAEEVRVLRAPAHRAAALADDLRRIEAPVLAANAALAKPGALDVLRQLTVLLPSDVQVSDLKIDGANVRLSGYCTDARKLTALLRRAGGFSHVAASAPGGKAADGRDMFEIEMSARAPAGERRR